MVLILGLLVIVGAIGVVAIPSLLWVAIGQGRRIEKLMDRNAVQAQALALQRPDASGYPILSTHGFERRSGENDPAAAILAKIADLAEAIGWQAGVGGMETAGAIVSYLAAHPEHTEALLAGEAGPIDWPASWLREGKLTWQALDGSIMSAERLDRRMADLAASEGAAPKPAERS